MSSNFYYITTKSQGRYTLSFNLVIECLLISTWLYRVVVQTSISSFNLVIECLLISTLSICVQALPAARFNLVIECLLISTQPGSLRTTIYLMLFQSRNRVSSNFYCMKTKEAVAPLISFNLVIECLLISTKIEFPVPSLHYNTEFQSRNRVSSNFYERAIKDTFLLFIRFNLVIECLLISTQ